MQVKRWYCYRVTMNLETGSYSDPVPFLDIWQPNMFSLDSLNMGYFIQCIWLTILYNCLCTSSLEHTSFLCGCRSIRLVVYSQSFWQHHQKLCLWVEKHTKKLVNLMSHNIKCEMCKSQEICTEDSFSYLYGCKHRSLLNLGKRNLFLYLHQSLWPTYPKVLHTKDIKNIGEGLVFLWWGYSASEVESRYLKDNSLLNCTV